MQIGQFWDGAHAYRLEGRTPAIPARSDRRPFIRSRRSAPRAPRPGKISADTFGLEDLPGSGSARQIRSIWLTRRVANAGGAFLAVSVDDVRPVAANLLIVAGI
jgi:hypothetical protein